MMAELVSGLGGLGLGCSVAYYTAYSMLQCYIASIRCYSTI